MLWCDMVKTWWVIWYCMRWYSLCIYCCVETLWFVILWKYIYYMEWIYLCLMPCLPYNAVIDTMIRCKRIYNFWCSMLVLHQFLYVLSILRCTFYAFSGTNLLTRCHSASSCFLLFLVSEKLHRKYSRNRTWQKPMFLFLPCRSNGPKTKRRRAAGRPHHA